MSLYRAFGLVISANIDLPELLQADPEALVDVRVHETPALPPPEMDDAGQLRIEVRGAGTFLIEHGSSIRYLRAEGSQDERIRLFLLGSCMGAILQQRGHVVLHGNAVSLDGKTCTLLVGRSGAGKSTAAAWHFKRGDSIVADDVCAVEFDPDGSARVIPAYPQIKLWRASADLLGISTERLRRVYERFDKFCLPLGGQFASEAMEIAEVIELAPEHAGYLPLRGIEKLHCLTRHSYRYAFVERMGIASEYRKKVIRLAGMVRIGRGARRNLAESASFPTPGLAP